MRILLDTHTFLWWITDSPRLSERAREVLADGRNEILLSAASSWEIAIENALGRLEVPGGDVEVVIASEIVDQGFIALPIEHAHAWRVASLPPHHRDPFDRILVAQALVEGVPILTSDSALARYEVETVW